MDECDYPFLMQRRWMAGSHNCAQTNVYGPRKNYKRWKKTILMHRIVMEAADNQIVDHINGDRLDNRRENLRFASSSENATNSRGQYLRKSKYAGVHKKKGIVGSRKWVAQIQRNNKKIFLGHFESQESAHEAVKNFSLKNDGQFSPYLGGVR